MSELEIELIKALGDDAQQAFYVYLVIEYGSMWLLVYLAYRWCKSIWKRANEKHNSC